MTSDGPTGSTPNKNCNCDWCQYEAGKIKLSPSTQTCYMVIIFVAFVYLLFWLLK